jgi:hypothetical protein
MGRKRVIVGQSEWGIDDKNVADVVAKVRTAMTSGTTVELVLLDGANRSVTVYLNGKLLPSVVVDLDMGPEPTEIPGA